MAKGKSTGKQMGQPVKRGWSMPAKSGNRTSKKGTANTKLGKYAKA